MLIQGFTGSGVNNHYPLHLMGMHGGTAPTTAAVTIGAQKWSGTNNRSALDGTTPILDIENNYSTAGSGGLVMRVMGDGKVGIGTAAPGELLDILGTDAEARIQSNGEGVIRIINASGSANQNSELVAGRSRGTIAVPTVVQDNDPLLGVWSEGYDGNSWTISSLIQTFIDGTPGDGDMPGRIEFQTQADGGGANIEGTTPEMVIKSNGAVGIGLASPASRFVVAAPSTEVIGAAATITANACGTVKRLSATANRTTDTTDTFTTPTASYAGCCMDVVNVDTVDTITLDNNANFITGPGADLAVGPGKAVRVCSDGTSWYQASTVTSAAATLLAIDDLTDAFTDYAVENNLIMGRTSAAALTAGAQRNTFIGQGAGATTANSTATTDSNTAVGYASLSSLTSGDQNTALGRNTLTNNLSGSYNVAVGNQALQQNTTGHGNTAIGSIALYSNVAKRESTAIGYSAMFYADSSAVSAVTYNTAVGAYALQGSATAADNTGTANTAIGHSALLGNTSGTNNTALGRDALSVNTQGYSNTAIGSITLANNDLGQSNVAVGYGVLASNTGSHASTGVGAGALGISTGGRNTALGAAAGDGITTGTDNIVIGYDADTPANNSTYHLNIGGTIFGDLANDNVRIGGSGIVGAGPFTVAPPSTEVVAAAAVITANACGSIKQISATANRTTDTTDTFTTPTAAYAGCCMDVVNVDTVDTITLDQNARFLTGPGTDLALGPNQAVRVCSDGTSWYQAASVSSIASGGNIPLSGLTAAIAANSINNADYAQTWNWQVTTADKDAFTFTENTASTATGHSSILKAATLATSTATPLIVTNLGAANSFVVNDETGDADTSPFIVKADGKVGIGTATPSDLLNIAGDLDDTGLLIESFTDASTYGGSGNVGFRRSRGSEGSETIIQNNDEIGHIFFQPYDGSAYTNGASIVAVVDGATGAGDTPTRLDFYTTPDGSSGHAHRMTIKNDGDVGIGTTAPAQKLHVASNVEDGITMEVANNATSSNVVFDARRSRGTLAAPTIVANNDEIGEYLFLGYDGNSYSHAGYFGFMVDGTPGDGDMPTRMEIQVQADGAGAWMGDGASVPELVIKSDGAVGIGLASPASRFVVASPTAEVIGAAATITANSCGTVKQISATANRTTNTTDTFTTPTASYNGCCMDVVNVDTVDTITLDSNANFITGPGTDLTLGPGKAVRVCSDGTSWYQAASITSVASGGNIPLSGLTAALADNSINNGNWNQVWNWQLAAGEVGFTFGENTASAGGTADQYILAAKTLATSTATPFMITNLGAADSFRVNDETGDADATPFIVKADGKVGVGTSSPSQLLEVYGTNAYISLLSNGEGAVTSTAASANWWDNGGFNAARSRGTIAAPTAVQSGDSVLTMWGTAYDGDTWETPALMQYFVDGTSGDGDMPGRIEFQTQADGAAVNPEATTPELVIKNSGNIGVSIAAPSAKLHVSNADAADSFRVDDVAGDTSPFVIDATGEVGIGITTPDDLLDIGANAEEGISVQVSTSGHANWNPFMYFMRSRGTMAAPTTVQNNDMLLDLTVLGHDGTDWVNGALITAAVDGTPGTNDMPTRLEFQVQADGAGNFLGDGVSTPELVIKSSGAVGVGMASPASRFVVASPTAEVIGAAAVITANACGTVKQISATANRTTNTTDTFTTPTASYNGCCMDVVNVDTVDTITLDQNGNFFTGPGTDLALGPGMGVRVCSDGTSWYQAGGVSSATAGGGGTIDGLTDAYADYTTLNNIIMGRTSAAALTAGAQYNLFIGENAGATSANSTAATDWNVALGHYALPALTSGHYNTALGALTLQANTSGNDNVAIGTLALNTNVTKVQSTAVGYRAMEFADSAAGGAVTYNTAVGAFALQGSATAASNTGTRNTAIGHSALLSITSGAYNTALGSGALRSNTDDSYNTAVGFEALGDNTGASNTALGSYALANNTEGASNVAVGNETLLVNTEGVNNVALGAGALFNNITKSESTAVGHYAMFYADSAAGGAITYNTAVGAYALQGSTTAADNTGTGNTAVGHSALTSNTIGVNNSAFGRDALTSNDEGNGNTAIGRSALHYSTWGSDNTALGDQALGSMQTASRNTALGSVALTTNETGSDNTAIGYNSGNGLVSGGSNILIGSGINTPANNTSNHLNIGGTIFGDVSTDNVRIGGSGVVGAGPFMAVSPTAEVIGAAATITANSCGTVKQISATANRTTDTTDTFTAPTASYNGCCMDVVNIDTVDTITLDQNAKFFTGAGTDLALAPGKAVRVCSDGTSWYQAGGVSSASAGTTALSGLTAAAADNSINNGNWNQVWNWQLAGAETGHTFGENVASTGGTADQYILAAKTLATSTATPFMITNLGAANSFRVNDETGDADATPFVIDASGNVGIGTATPGNLLDIRGAIPGVSIFDTDAAISANNPAFRIRSQDNLGSGLAGMAFQTTADYSAYTTGMVMRADGNVGIGIANPDELLDIGADAEKGLSVQVSTSGDPNWNPYIQTKRSRGTMASPTAVQNGDMLLDFIISGHDGSNFRTAAMIEAVVDGAVTGGGAADMPTRLEFQVQADGAGGWLGDGASTPEMVIKSNGAVGIGTATPNAGAKLDVAGPIFLDGLNDGSTGDLFFGGGGWPYSIGVGWAGQDNTLRFNAVGTSGGTADFRNVMILDGKTNPFAFFQGSTKRLATGGDDSTPDAMLEVIKDSTSPLFMLSASAAGNGDLMIVDTNGNVGVGLTSPASKFVVASPTAEVVGAAATITANACGTVKQISATANRTTNTTDTFTTPTSAYSGCCMDVVNIDTVDTITLDQNGNFFTGAGTDVALGPGKGVRVCSDGTDWYQAGGVSSASAGTTALSGLTAAAADNSINNGNWNQVWNWQLAGAETGLIVGENTASAGGTIGASGNQFIMKASTLATSTATPFIVTNLGAANSFRVNDETGDADATPFVIDASGNVGIGTAAPTTLLEITSSTVEDLLVLNVANDTAGTDPSILLQRSRGTLSARTTVSSGDNLGAIWAMGYDGSNMEYAASIEFEVDGGVATAGDTTDMPGAIRFKTTPDGSNLPLERMRIDDAGNVGIGTVSPAELLHVAKDQNGSTAIRLSNATAGASAEAQYEVVTDVGNLYMGMNSSTYSTNPGDTYLINQANTDMRFATNNTYRMIIEAGGDVGIGNTSPASLFVVGSPTAEVIGAAATITANSCGTVKQISATANRTTNTTDTFTTPTASHNGCCMDVVNIDTVDTITLDQNGNFFTGAGTDVALGPGKGVRVCSDGTSWYQAGGVSSGAATTLALDDLTDALTDYAVENNLIMGRAGAAALAAGAQRNTFIGQDAGATTANSTIDTDSNTAVGYAALRDLTSGSQNTAVGRNALADTTDGVWNVAVGNQALEDNTSGNGNVAVGTTALYSNVAKRESTAIGHSAMFYADDTAVDGVSYNTAVGAYALQGSATAGNNTGTENTALGHSTLMANTSGSDNVAIGKEALKANTTASDNTAIGESAMLANTTGAMNTAMGSNALYQNIGGSANVAVGDIALGSTTASGNTAVGFEAGYAGTANTSGTYNTFIGHQAQANANNYTNATALGNGAIVTASNMMMFGNSSVTTNVFNGNVGIGTATPATNLHVASNAETFLFVDSAATNQWLNPTILGRRSRGTLASPTIVADDDELFAIGSYAYDGNSYEVGGYIGFYTDGTPGNADMPTRITLFTAPDGSATSLPRMTVNNAGNVGIGTSDPTAPLHIKKATDDWSTATFLLEGDGEPTLSLQTSSAFDYFNPIIGTSRSRGSRAAKTAVASGDSLFEISTSGYDGSNDRVAFYMAAVVDGTVTGGGAADMPTRLEFHVQADGAGGGLEGTTPDMVIKNNGNVGIAMASPSVKLDVTGDIEYTGTIADVSDIRLKKDIHPLSERGSMLHKLGLIDTYSFKMKDSEVDQVEFGVMAQEIEKIFPELVRTADDEMGTKSVNYTGLIAPMIEAGKELEAQNKAMKAEIEALKARQDEMKQAMNEITEDMKGLKVHTGYGIGKAEMSLLMILAALGTLGAAGLARRRFSKPRQ